ncbi:MAG: hypothetical protein A3K66_01525 [Euryarchaeota archaeon RBG_16_67_27]|nr:MAG: hypothetical protein A3K66_01525 [Euryarchaeota archaeon RBG_16_67_27]
MLQQAVRQFLEAEGWDVEADGAILQATRGESEVVIGILRPEEVPGFVERSEGSSASLAAILLDPLSDADVIHLEEVGILAFDRTDIEDVVLAGWLKKGRPPASPFLEFLRGA